MIHFHMQRFKFSDFMVIELCFFKKKKKKKKKKKMENMDKMWKALFEIIHMFYIIDQQIFVYWLFFTHSLPWYHYKWNQLQIKSENEQNPYIWFSMGIDHSNPYIHSTTVLCDYGCMPSPLCFDVSLFLSIDISTSTAKKYIDLVHKFQGLCFPQLGTPGKWTLVSKPVCLLGTMGNAQALELLETTNIFAMIL